MSVTVLVHRFAYYQHLNSGNVFNVNWNTNTITVWSAINNVAAVVINFHSARHNTAKLINFIVRFVCRSVTNVADLLYFSGIPSTTVVHVKVGDAFEEDVCT